MPITSIEALQPGGYLGIWTIRENEHFFRSQLQLTPAELKGMSGKQGMRRLEWLAARYLVQYLSPPGAVCRKDQFGKPYLANYPFHVSISHSRGAVAVAIARTPVGVDIQGFSAKINDLAFKFLHQKEAQYVTHSGYDQKQLHLFWGAKEVLYKACGRRDLLFKDHIFIPPFQYLPSGGECEGVVEKEDYSANFHLHYRELDNYLLVYGTQL